MSRLPFVHPVFGREDLDPLVSDPLFGLADDPPAPGEEADSGTEISADDFARVVSLLRSNEQLLGALEGVSQRLHAVRTYLAHDDCNVNLGREYYQYWRTKHSSVLTRLRANRLEARRLLRRIDAVAFERSAIADEPRLPS